MKRLWVFLLCLPVFAAGNAPNRYMVELSTESVGAHVMHTAARGTGRRLLHTASAEQHRTLVRAQQAAIRPRIEAAEGKILGALETIDNALLVQIDDSKASRLSSIPGVKNVYPARVYNLLLDHALPLHHVPQAWTQVGIGNAGAGIKIGLIDSGIDIKHPGFADGGFTAPAGFPLADSQADLAFTNNKVIVARSYAAFFPTQDPDLSANDHVGHGTATSMVAAGVSNPGPLATISGVAPQAYLGMYKVFGTPGYNDGASTDVILMAIEDALNDGMDIISMSLGINPAPRVQSDPEAQILDIVDALGAIVVVAAGNGGPDPSTISSPGDAPAVIAAGAVINDRYFAYSVVLPDNSSMAAVPGNGAYGTASITGNLVDVTNLDATGQACSTLPAGSLTNAVALIQRGNCPFAAKIAMAQTAGASAVIVYDNIPGEAPFTMAVGTTTLPAVLVANADGLALQAKLITPLAVTVQFVLSPYYTNPAAVAGFSAAGPNLDYTIKPDVMAVGQNIYTATQKLDSNGEMYDASGYILTQGTSFSAPLVAGAAAILKQAHPGLTSDQYRSLLINSADAAYLIPGTPAGVQQGGAGVLNVLSAVNGTIAASPVSLSFGTGGSTVNSTQNLTLTNVGRIADTFQISLAPSANNSTPAPQLSVTSVALDPGASVTLPVQFQASSLSPGAYEGFINVQGVQSGAAAHVPYWYGVPSGQPAHITVLSNNGAALPAGPAGSRQTIDFRITDAIGYPVTNVQPSVSAVSSGAQAGPPSSIDYQIPNAYAFTVRLAPSPGSNIYQIQAGSLTQNVTITGQ